jgi:NAD(P)-dependent dehydrogenase (short-subunit alcohol dehydrogenase family)
MRELAGKTAFVTGGASGIGLALGRAFAQAGMKVMLADIETEALSAAVNSLHDSAPDVRSVVCDVADPASVERAAQASYQAFGNVHIVCNNAGVAAAGGIDNIALDNWRWVLDVNLMGVLHGIRTFLPHIRGHGEGGHIVNTASMAGINIGQSGRNRPQRYGPAQPPDPKSPAAAIVAEIARRLEAGLDPAAVAARVLEAIRNDELYVFTHPDMREEVDQRFAAIQAAMDKVNQPKVAVSET